MKYNWKLTILSISILFNSFVNIVAQTTDSTKQNLCSDYSFIIQDSPARLFTIRQMDEDYLSTYRLISTTLNKNFKPVVSYGIQASAFLILFGSLTHEESHRSILVSKNIGSISEPFLLSSSGGYVFGVTDQTLQNMRDTDFPDFILLAYCRFGI